MNAILPIAVEGGRPPEIEDLSNRLLIHPIGEALLGPAKRLGIAPNAVSLTGLGFGLLAALAYWHWQQPLFVVCGFAAMIAWHILDGLDGKLARATGRTSSLGRVLDGTCDYLVFATVEMAIVFSHADWLPMLALCLTAAAAHVFQAAAYEGERAAWLRRAAGRFESSARPRLAGWLTAGHHWIETRLGDRQRPIDLAMARRPGLLPRYLAATAPALRSLSVLGANGRTVALALCCLAGAPALYWAWTLFGLTAIGLWRAAALRRAEARLIG